MESQWQPCLTAGGVPGPSEAPGPLLRPTPCRASTPSSQLPPRPASPCATTYPSWRPSPRTHPPPPSTCSPPRHWPRWVVGWRAGNPVAVSNCGARNAPTGMSTLHMHTMMLGQLSLMRNPSPASPASRAGPAEGAAHALSARLRGRRSGGGGIRRRHAQERAVRSAWACAEVVRLLAGKGAGLTCGWRRFAAGTLRNWLSWSVQRAQVCTLGACPECHQHPQHPTAPYLLYPRGPIRDRARLLITNPDMLHMSILPVHGQFESLLRGLRYVVLDEGHAYKGAGMGGGAGIR